MRSAVAQGQQNLTAAPLRLATFAMGTRFEVAILAGADGSSEAGLAAAGEAAMDEIQDWHRRLTRFAPDSLVSHINRAAADGPVRLDEDTWALLSDALEVWRDSGGAFDVTVAPLMRERGFADSAVPVAALWRAGCGGLELDASARTIRFTAGRTSIDLGGIAKGHAIDHAAAVLRSFGVTQAFLHGGTSSGAAIGCAPEGVPWRVALDARGETVLDLTDTAYSVSDAASQTSSSGATHIVDPRDPTGATMRTGRTVGRVVVTGPSARLADAWSTALVVLGDVPAAFPRAYTARWL